MFINNWVQETKHWDSVNDHIYFITVIKQRMEKDVDEVGKIARNIKTKLEEIDRDVMFQSLYFRFLSHNTELFEISFYYSSFHI